MQQGWIVLHRHCVARGRQILLAFLWGVSLPLLAAEREVHRHYAPDREVDLLHLTIDVTPDFQKRAITGTTTLRFRPNVESLRVLRLDAVDLRVRSVESAEPIQGWQLTTNQIVVTFAEMLPADRDTLVQVTYDAEPKEGLYFRTPEMGYRDGETHLFTQGETELARHWYPGIDHPNERFTSEVICHVPAGMTAFSNGRLISQEPDANGRIAFRWFQDRTHVNYLVALVAGHFRTLADRYRDVPIALHTLPSAADQAASTFRGTADMLAFFEAEIGVPYPWAKYDQVCVNDFVAGGMENTSLTILTDNTLFTDATENLFDSEGLVAHELAHQWFGDLVTCKDWSQLWLNEGFATYYEALYTRHARGRDAFRYEMYQRARDLVAQANDVRPIVRRTFADSGEMFDHLTYPKAAWVLHMLRCQLGEPLYRRCVRTYLERHAYGSVATDDFNDVLEELSGRSWDQFLDQWIYHGGYPDLQVNYSWNEPQRQARVSIRQQQPVNDQVLLFRLPLTLRFELPSGRIDHPVELRTASEDFYVPLASAPVTVRIDPELTLLARIRFEPPAPMLHAQLTNACDVVGRLLAVENLSQQEDQDAVARLRDRLNQDPFHGVRIEASSALRRIHSDEALTALAASRRQSDARVRLQVVQDLGAFFHETARAALQETLAEERNPEIIAAALEGLGRYHSPEITALLRQNLGVVSYRERIALAALRGLRRQDNAAVLPEILSCLEQRASDFPAGNLGEALEILAYLARNEEQRAPVCTFLLQRVNHPRRAIQLAAISALGTLGDPLAIAPLEAFTQAGPENRQRHAAERALAQIRGQRKPSEELPDLRKRLDDLEREHRDARKQVEELRKKLDALPPSAPQSPAATNTSMGPTDSDWNP